MLGKAKQGGGAEDAIVEVVEGVADHLPQRPFSSLKESILMVQRRACFSFQLSCRGEEWWFLCSYDFTYRGSSLVPARGKRKLFNKCLESPNSKRRPYLFFFLLLSPFCLCLATAELGP